MSTGKKNTQFKQRIWPASRFAQLAQLGETLFHARDLANLWQIKNKNTLYTTLKRYLQKGLIFRIYKGLYSLKPIDEIDPMFLGTKALHTYAYISTETILAQKGIMQQQMHEITLISDISKHFSIGSHQYRSRKLQDIYLYNPIGITQKNGINMASTSRAVADMLYFNPQAYFDAGRSIDWKKVKQLQKQIGYPLTKQYYDSSK